MYPKNWQFGHQTNRGSSLLPSLLVDLKGIKELYKSSFIHFYMILTANMYPKNWQFGDQTNCESSFLPSPLVDFKGIKEWVPGENFIDVAQFGIIFLKCLFVDFQRDTKTR